MYKKILVPIDGSVASMHGLQEAIKLAKGQATKLKIVNVVEDWVPSGGILGETYYPANLIDEMRAHGKRMLEKAAKMADKAGVACTTELLEQHSGQPASAILKQAASWKADLIVLGTHGRRGIRRLVMGSDAEEIVRNAPVPTLLVRARA